MSDVLFASGDVLVTRTIARFGETSYPIANIGSIATASSIEPSAGANVAVAVGLVGALAVGLFISWGAALMIFLAAAIWLFKQPLRTETTLVLKTSSGDVQALKSSDTELVTSVKQAIETAFDGFRTQEHRLNSQTEPTS